MICIKCGLNKGSEKGVFECDDCITFSSIVKTVFEDVHDQMEREEIIDPDTSPILRLLADSSFLTSSNPQTAIFYKISDYLLTRASIGDTEITEDDLNRYVTTIRGWEDTFKLFSELNLITIRNEKYRRVLILTNKMVKFANQYQLESISDIGIRKRLAHIYAGYVLLCILNKVASLSEESWSKSILPYSQKPRTLWISLMFLWSNAFNNTEQFSEEDLRKFIAKRRIPSASRGKIIGALQAMDGKNTQGLIKDVRIEDGERQFTFEDYVMIEMQRIRELVRERER
jgi:hypothetical protein